MHLKTNSFQAPSPWVQIPPTRPGSQSPFQPGLVWSHPSSHSWHLCFTWQLIKNIKIIKNIKVDTYLWLTENMAPCPVLKCIYNFMKSNNILFEAIKAPLGEEACKGERFLPIHRGSLVGNYIPCFHSDAFSPNCTLPKAIVVFGTVSAAWAHSARASPVAKRTINC